MRQAILLLLGWGLVPAQAQTIGLLENAAGNLDGYVLFSPIPYTMTYLIDKCGRSVHTWSSGYKPGQAVYLMNDGSIMRSGVVANANFNNGGRGGLVEHIAWDGTLLWSYQISDATQCSHHDIHPMANGHVLVIVWETHSTTEAIAQGRDPALLAASLWCEKVIELEPVGTNQANVAWEWHLWDHLVQDLDATKPNYGVVADHPELLDLNFVNGTAQPDWIHANAIDYNEELDQILLSSHNLSEVWVIDHSTSTNEAASHVGGTHGHGGDLLYRWGNPQVYDRGATADKKFFGQHNAQWIRPGLPRAGEIMVFNNGLARPGGAYSSIDIIVPPVDPNGDYAINGADPFAPVAEDFTWTAPVPTDFYAMNISGAQALPNGGFVACDGPGGTFIELDPDGAEVWRYVNPVNIGGPMTQGAAATGNTVFRCTWIPLDHPGLAGHALVPGDPIELQPIANACTSLGVNDGGSTSGMISIAPVPTSDHVRMSGIPVPCTVELVDMLGARIGSWNIVSGTTDLDLSAFPNGSYVLRSQDGKGISVGRIIIAR